MTNRELNVRIKRLWKRYMTSISNRDSSHWNNEEWQSWEDERDEIKKEYQTLYWADQECEYMNLTSFKMMVKMNLPLRVIELHNAFYKIKI